MTRPFPTRRSAELAVRVTVEVARVEPRERHQFMHGLRPTPGIADTVDHQRLADDIRDGHARIERAVGILEHVLNATPEVAQFASGPSEHVHLPLAVVTEAPSSLRGEGPPDDPPTRGRAAPAPAHHAAAPPATDR